jgi:hypothetical protein
MRCIRSIMKRKGVANAGRAQLRIVRTRTGLPTTSSAGTDHGGLALRQLGDLSRPGTISVR